jgi:hypothetical protein
MAQTQWIKITTFTMDSGKHPLRSRLLLRLGIFLLLPVLLLFVPAGAAETTPPKTAACWFDDLTYDIQTNTHPKPTRLQVSPNGRFLQYADGRPFFYLADTAWMLPNKLTEEEARRLFADRSAKGFTVIQSLIFRDLFVPNSANVHGVKPFASEADMYAAKLNPKWLDWVVRITKMAAEHGLVMAWLPTWGDKWTKRNNSAGPVIFDKDSKAEAYGRDLSEAMKECDNVIWVLGGDSDIETPAQADIMRAMARGLRSGAKRGRNLQQRGLAGHQHRAIGSRTAEQPELSTDRDPLQHAANQALSGYRVQLRTDASRRQAPKRNRTGTPCFLR